MMKRSATDQKGLARPAFLPAIVVALACRVLPGGSCRSRYRQEFTAELYGMPLGRQTTHALQIAASSWSLRSAVAHPHGKGRNMLTIVRSKPLLCLLNVRHHWHQEITEDGTRFQRCTKCGKDRLEFGPLNVDWKDRNKFGL
jgi:hypothetical protein